MAASAAEAWTWKNCCLPSSVTPNLEGRWTRSYEEETEWGLRSEKQNSKSKNQVCRSVQRKQTKTKEETQSCSSWDHSPPTPPPTPQQLVLAPWGNLACAPRRPFYGWISKSQAPPLRGTTEQVFLSSGKLCPLPICPSWIVDVI